MPQFRVEVAGAVPDALRIPPTRKVVTLDAVGVTAISHTSFCPAGAGSGQFVPANVCVKL